MTCLIAVGSILGVDSRATESDVLTLSDDATAFLTSYCADCHMEGAQEGGLAIDLDTLNDSSLVNHAIWVRIHDRVDRGEMPPTDYDTIPRRDRAVLLQPLGEILRDQHRRNNGATLRRLNRREYQNTMNDMFGTHVNLMDRLPEDGQAHGFDTVGHALGISSVHLRQYIDAADSVVDAAIAKSSTPTSAETINASYADSREGGQFIGKVWKKLDDDAVVFFDDFGYPTGMLRGTSVKTPGRYRIEVTGYAHQSDQPITAHIGGTSFQRGSEKPTYGYVSFPPGRPTTIQLEAWIDERYMIQITPWGLDTGQYNIRKSGPDDYEGPGLAIKNVSLVGPLLDEFPSRGHRLIFGEMDRREIPPSNPKHRLRSSYRASFKIVSDDPDQEVHEAVRRVASQAFRRPVRDDEVALYWGLYRSERDRGASIEQALRTAVSGVLCSPDFLYFVEPSGKLNDHAVATRLSYFLNRTAPDASLRKAADDGRLSDPDERRRQVDRLLESERSDRFIQDFADAWLNLREIEFTNPDERLFPEYDGYLLHSMKGETHEFLRHAIRVDLPSGQLIDPGFAMLNERLAKHYQIPDVGGPQIRLVQLNPSDVRGGLLAQASILKSSANGTNTSPVVRGVWVTERILGQIPPPPPPGIPGVEPDIRGAATLREQLDKHRNLVSCQSCHQIIDPPGFALECFDPVGGWRTRYRSLGEGDRVNRRVDGRSVRYRLAQPVDASGQTVQGDSFDGFVQFREIVAANDRRIAQTVVEKLLTFAIGREPGFSDREEIDRIVDSTRSSGYGFRSLIHSVVASELFRTK
ncbi:DUF1592 domain-containing protein [Crateriforma spongiae]|uniref:DUF1592 domain-containing protein n=1 Tax=Crateriforma spongiae TaxID=2724528 RepID=UPI001446631B|nr:DUF1592 domain-containing protein [Crateriforma spongiae]